MTKRTKTKNKTSVVHSEATEESSLIVTGRTEGSSQSVSFGGTFSSSEEDDFVTPSPSDAHSGSEYGSNDALPSIEPGSGTDDLAENISRIAIIDDTGARSENDTTRTINLGLTLPDASDMASNQTVSMPSPVSETSSLHNETLVSGFEAMRLVADDRTLLLNNFDRQEGHSPSSDSGLRCELAVDVEEIHSVDNEEPPIALFYQPEVQKALSTSQESVARVLNVLSSSNLHTEDSSTIQSLYHKSLELALLPNLLPRIVGLIGDSGVGKSSLINSLLDRKELARASGSGGACTCAVTEYAFHDRSDYLIHIDFFTIEEIQIQIEEFLRAYRDHKRFLETGPGDGIAEEKASANLATQTLQAMFLEELADNPDVLSLETFERAVKTMISWASRLIPESQGRERYETLKQCSARLRELSSETKESSSGRVQIRWPFIRKLRVFSNAYVLSKGLVLADLPGLRDQNAARRRITQRYIRQCHQIFAVAPIERGSTDESLTTIFSLADDANLSKVDIVFIGSDRFILSEAKHDWPSHRAELEKLETSLSDSARELKRLNKRIEELDELDEERSQSQKEELKMLRKQRKDIRQTEIQSERDSTDLVIRLRNHKVSETTQRQYNDHRTAATTKSFCVSNALYWKHRERPLTSSKSYLVMSGIFELRQYCIGIFADIKFRATTEYIKDQVPAFLGSVQLWVDVGSGNANAERKQYMLDKVGRLQQNLRETSSSRFRLYRTLNDLRDVFDRHIIEQMRRHNREWANEARDASEEWNGWNSSSYKAFCANRGRHTTKAQGSRCWNQEATAAMREHMTGVWDDASKMLDASLTCYRDEIENAFDKFIRRIAGKKSSERGNFRGKRVALETLTEIVLHRKSLALSGVKNAVDEFKNLLSRLEVDTLSSLQTSFIGELMEEAYHEACQECGDLSDTRRKTIITGRFGSRDLFKEHREACEMGFEDMLASFESEAEEATNQQVHLLEEDLLVLRDENVILESERDPQFRNRVSRELVIISEHLHEARCAIEPYI